MGNRIPKPSIIFVNRWGVKTGEKWWGRKEEAIRRRSRARVSARERYVLPALLIVPRGGDLKATQIGVEPPAGKKKGEGSLELSTRPSNTLGT